MMHFEITNIYILNFHLSTIQFPSVTKDLKRTKENEENKNASYIKMVM